MGCKLRSSEKRKPEHISDDHDSLATISTLLNGKRLSLQYCQGCHVYVPPKMLPKAIWKDNVLPAMGHRLGIYEGRSSPPDSLFEKGKAEALIRQAHVYPLHRLLSREAWHAIVNYYVNHAPDRLTHETAHATIRMQLPYFKYKVAHFSRKPPLTNMVDIVPERGEIVFSDGKRDGSSLNFLDKNLDRRYDIMLPTVPIHFRIKSDTIYVTTIGRKILPSDAPDGAVLKFYGKNKNQPATSASVILKNLQRPVHTAYTDLNQDGRGDIILCEFGNLTGKLAWYENLGNDRYKTHILKRAPGATRVIVKDINNDGMPDLFVLMAQGDEGILLFVNRGGQFVEKRLLRFSPLNGSTYFDLADFNQDGYPDIIYTCGDNADKTPILKNYHGVYIFINDGNLNFSQKYFYPMYGAYKALARDYDQDGDLDIAAISFFPDYLKSPGKSFVYLRNEGQLSFQAFSFPAATHGRWMVMDSDDLDADGDIDIALGSFIGFEPERDTTGLYDKWLKDSPSVVLLENTIYCNK